jgi:hypothetical protein
MVEWEAANIARSPDKSSSHSHDPSSPYDDHDANNSQASPSSSPTRTHHDSHTTASPNSDAGGPESGPGMDRDSTHKPKRRRLRSSETPEAALARLTSSYSAAMSAVGALHKASHDRVQAQMHVEVESSDSLSPKESEPKKPSIQRAAKAARDAFEHAVISDPLIEPYCPTFSHVLSTGLWVCAHGY